MSFQFCPTCFGELAQGAKCSRCGEYRSIADAPGDVLRPGSVLGGKYKVGRLLGRGGFGATYLAWDMNLQVRIAIKEFLPRQLAARTSGGMHVSAYTGTQEGFDIGLQQFLSEARNLAQFRDHPGIISVLDFFPENGTGYMVMEYLDGSTLEQYMTAVGHLDTEVVLRLLIPVADALKACHAAGLIHRDISPDNIFLTADGRVKLLDFGAARFAIGSRSTNLSVILKEGYAPFEQYQRNGRQGPWTDIYALTGTLYRLLTGALPVAAPDRIAGTPLPPPSEKGVKISPRLQTLLDKGMAIESEQRYQKIDDFLSDLEAVIGGRGPLPPPVPRRRWKLAITLVGAIGLVGVATAIVMPWTDQSPVEDEEPTPVPVRPPVITPPPAARNIVAETPPPARPPEPPAQAVKGVSLESVRQYIKNAAQDQIQLRLALTQTRSARTALNKLQNISVKTESISQAIQQEEATYRSADNDREDSLNKYIADVELLAGVQKTEFESAMQMENDSANTPSIDPKKAESKAQISSAIDELRSDVREQQQRHLTREAITDRLNTSEIKR
jgi:serine/threonine protein kinase